MYYVKCLHEYIHPQRDVTIDFFLSFARQRARVKMKVLVNRVDLKLDEL